MGDLKYIENIDENLVIAKKNDGEIVVLESKNFFIINGELIKKDKEELNLDNYSEEDQFKLIDYLPNGLVLAIDSEGNVRTLREGDYLQIGEVLVSNKEKEINLVTENELSNITQEVNNEIEDLILAIESGQDPTLNEDLAPAAGGDTATGSSLDSSGTITRTGAETIASTSFETTGIESLGLSTTQFLSIVETTNEDTEATTLNTPPTATDITVTTNEDTEISGILEAEDLEGDDLTYSILNQTENGTLILSENESWVYAPNENYDGVDQATIFVQDSFGNSTSFLININVLPIPEISISGDSIVSEGNVASYLVNFDKESNEDTIINISLNYQTAEENDIESIKAFIGDIELILSENGDLVIPSGETNIRIEVKTTQDAIFESDELYTINVSSVEGTVGEDSTSTIIQDGGEIEDDDRPTISITGGGDVAEGDFAYFTLEKSGETELNSTVKVELSNISTENNDIESFEYKNEEGEWVEVPNDGILTIGSDVSEIELRVKTTQNEVFEGAESFEISVEAIENILGTDSSSATIYDDGSVDEEENDQPTISITGGGDVAEGDFAYFTLEKSGETELNSTVKVELSNISTENDDIESFEYKNSDNQWVEVPNDGILTIGSDVSEVELRVKTTQNEVFEGAESFEISVEAVENILGTDSSSATIYDDGSVDEEENDQPKIVSISNEEVLEGDQLEFKVNLSNESETKTEVEIKLTNVTTSDLDYEKTKITIKYEDNTTEEILISDNVFKIEIPEGDTKFNIIVSTIDDTIIEEDEIFNLEIKTEYETTFSSGVGKLISNEAPIIDLNGINEEGNDFTTNFIEGTNPVSIVDEDLDIFDDKNLIKEMSIILKNPEDQDQLIYNTIDTSKFTISVISNVLLIESISENGLSAEEFESALKEIQFNNTSETFNTTDRIIEIFVIDNIGLSSDKAATTITMQENTPPESEDLDISFFGGTTTINLAEQVSDFEDDLLLDDNVLIEIMSKPEFGEIYYINEVGEKVELNIGDRIKETTDIKYTINYDLVDLEEIKEEYHILAEDLKELLDGSEVLSIDGLFEISGGITTQNIDGSLNFENKGTIVYDQAMGEKGFAINTEDRGGRDNGGEIGLEEFISIKFEDISITEGILNLGSINGLFNGGHATIKAYYYKDGELLNDSPTDLVVTERVNGHNKEGDAIIENESPFDEIRLIIETDNPGRGAGFVLQGFEVTEITSIPELEDSFTYKAIDSRGLESEVSEVTLTGDNNYILPQGSQDKLEFINNTLVWNEEYTFEEIEEGVLIDSGDEQDYLFLTPEDDTIYLGNSSEGLLDVIPNNDELSTLNFFSNYPDGYYLEDSYLVYKDNQINNDILTESMENSKIRMFDENETQIETNDLRIDFVNSSGGSDTIFGESGVNIIFSGSGADIVFGGSGIDLIRGGSGNDVLCGGSGDDIIIGGIGNDKLSGGAGADIFKFIDQGLESRIEEVDIITDFSNEEDKIDLSDLLDLENNDLEDLLMLNVSDNDLILKINETNQEIVIKEAKTLYEDYISGGEILNQNYILEDLLKVSNES